MKKLNPRILMLRPSDGFLPLAWALASALGRSEMADRAFHYLLLARLFALATAPGLRQAFAGQPSMRKARGSVTVALLAQPVGALLVAALELLTNGGRVAPSALVCVGAGLLLNIEHVFYEYLCAAGEGHSAALSRAVCAILQFGGLMLTAERSSAGLLPYASEWLLGAAAVSAAVSAVVGVAIGGRLKGRPNPEVLRCAPRAMLHCCLYPLLCLLAGLVPGSPVAAAGTSAPFFAGLLLCELWRTPFRRSAMESRPMWKALGVVAASCLAALAVTLLPVLPALLRTELRAASLSLLIASACVAGMYGNIGGMGAERSLQALAPFLNRKEKNL